MVQSPAMGFRVEKSGAVPRTHTRPQWNRATHQTFVDYCKGRWGMSKSRAQQLINSAAMHMELKTITTVTVLPENERQMRQLIRLGSPEEAAEVLAESAEDDGKLTAKKLKVIVDERLEYEPPEPDVLKPNRPTARVGCLIVTHK